MPECVSPFLSPLGEGALISLRGRRVRNLGGRGFCVQALLDGARRPARRRLLASPSVCGLDVARTLLSAPGAYAANRQVAPGRADLPQGAALPRGPGHVRVWLPRCRAFVEEFARRIHDAIWCKPFIDRRAAGPSIQGWLHMELPQAWPPHSVHLCLICLCAEYALALCPLRILAWPPHSVHLCLSRFCAEYFQALCPWRKMAP